MVTTHFMTSLDLGAPRSVDRVRVRIERLEETIRAMDAHCDPRDIEHDVEEILPALIALREAGLFERREQLMRVFIGDAAPRPVDTVRAKMQASARIKVFEGSEWLTAAQIADLAGLSTKNPSGTVNRWKNGGQIFAMHFNGQDWYPRYALGDDFRPLPAMAQVLKELAGWKPERLASWFEAKSGSLDGARPRELIASEPQQVVDAARSVVAAEKFSG